MRQDKPSLFSHLQKFVAFVALLLMVLLTAVGCSTSSASGTTSTGTNPLAPGQYGGSYAGGTATGDTQEGAQFAQWVLQQDPQHQYITDAVVRNDQVLGVKVNPNVTKADVQKLLVSLTQGMAKTFPGKPLTVDAFYQSGDKLAEATYDPNSGQINVQFTQ